MMPLTTSQPSQDRQLQTSGSPLLVLPETGETRHQLIVTHDDAHLVRRLQRALRSKHAAILPIPQNRWNFRDEHNAELIFESLRQQPVHHVTLVAHSRADVPSRAGRGPLQRGFAQRFVDGQRRVCQIEQHLIEQHELLSHACASNEADFEVEIDAMLYRAEAGEFVAYDSLARDFSSLGARRMA